MTHAKKNKGGIQEIHWHTDREHSLQVTQALSSSTVHGRDHWLRCCWTLGGITTLLNRVDQRAADTEVTSVRSQLQGGCFRLADVACMLLAHSDDAPPVRRKFCSVGSGGFWPGWTANCRLCRSFASAFRISSASSTSSIPSTPSTQQWLSWASGKGISPCKITHKLAAGTRSTASAVMASTTSVWL